ncbi:MAG: caspase family protein [Bacteroidales bacterium]|nr:caspase family protein [Bacteroidales bacterium]
MKKYTGAILLTLLLSGGCVVSENTSQPVKKTDTAVKDQNKPAIYSVKTETLPNVDNIEFTLVCYSSESYSCESYVVKSTTCKKPRALPFMSLLIPIGCTGVMAASGFDESTKFLVFSWVLPIAFMGSKWTKNSTSSSNKPGPEMTYYSDPAPLKNKKIKVKAGTMTKYYTSDAGGKIRINPEDLELTNFTAPQDVEFQFAVDDTPFENSLTISSVNWTNPYVRVIANQTPVVAEKGNRRLVTGVKGMDFEYLSILGDYYKVKCNEENAFIATKDAQLVYATPRTLNTADIDYRLLIKDYVTDKITKWQQQGEFEKDAEYLNRVNEENRQKQIDVYTREAIIYYGKEKVNLSNPALHRYDPNHETFKITFENGTEILLPVPIDEAPQFKDNFKSIHIINPEFGLYQNQFVLTYLTFRMDDSKSYQYDASKSVAYGKNAVFTVNFKNVDIQVDDVQIAKAQDAEQKTVNITIGRPDIDVNIPETGTSKKNTYALIIGNEDYSSYQTGLDKESNVDFAANDAEIFKAYLIKTLGVPEKNINLLVNATYGQMKQGISKIKKLIELSDGKAEIFFYYSGHGLPDEVTKEPYLMPVDITGTNVTSAIKVEDIYKEFSEFPSARVVVILDACFSGGARNQGLVALKAVKVKPKDNAINGNILVISSSTGEESSNVYKEKMHGLFTYYLLEKLQQSQGNITYKELFDYLQKKVSIESVLLLNKTQTPQISGSQDVMDVWEDWKLR